MKIYKRQIQILLLIFYAIFLFFASAINDSFIIADYKNILISSKKIIITNEEIQFRIEQKLMPFYKTKNILNRGVKKKDIVTFDYTAYIREELFDEALQVAIIIGDYNFIKELENAMIGMKINESRKIEIIIPHDYSNKFSNQVATFNIKISKIDEIILPELTSNFLKKEFNFSNKKMFIKSVENELYEEKKEIIKQNKKQQILDKIIQDSKFDSLPQEQLIKQYKQIKQSYQAYANLYDISYEQVLENFNYSETEMKEVAEKIIKENMVINKIMKLENLNITEHKFNDLALQYIETLGYTNINNFINDNGKTFLKREVYKQYVLDFLYELLL